MAGSSILAMLSMAASITVGLVFIAAAVAKLRAWSLLPGVIANYRILPETASVPVAKALPIVELAVGAALVLGLSPWGQIAAALLLTAFACAMALNITRGRRHIDCGCGRSQLRQPLSWIYVGRNGLLATIVLTGLADNGPLSAMDLFTASAAGVSLYLLYVLAHSFGAPKNSATLAAHS